MRRRKYREALKYLAVAVIAAAATAFFFLHPAVMGSPSLTLAPSPEKKTTGYKAEDRQRLERLIHNEGKDD